jgi:hypothetical protein
VLPVALHVNDVGPDLGCHVAASAMFDIHHERQAANSPPRWKAGTSQRAREGYQKTTVF